MPTTNLYEQYDWANLTREDTQILLGFMDGNEIARGNGSPAHFQMWPQEPRDVARWTF